MTSAWVSAGTGAFAGGVMVSYAACALFLFKRRRAARKLEPPERLLLLRSPGESLLKKMEELTDTLVNHMFMGSIAALLLGGAPLLVVQVVPKANPLILLGSGALLFAASSIWIVRTLLRLLDELANARLGYFGECFVAEHLQPVIARRYRIFHDVPVDLGGRIVNVDHVVIGAHGAVVIETKTYSKPTDHKRGPVEVVFDGKRIAWPRYPNDTKTLWQVKKNAEWLQGFVREQCGINIPVAEVVAIPGWRVIEKRLTWPRVVSGRGVADAVLHAIQTDREPCLTESQLDNIARALEKLCRDVTP